MQLLKLQFGEIIALPLPLLLIVLYISIPDSAMLVDKVMLLLQMVFAKLIVFSQQLLTLFLIVYNQVYWEHHLSQELEVHHLVLFVVHHIFYQHLFVWYQFNTPQELLLSM